jgi:hypothetical protein
MLRENDDEKWEFTFLAKDLRRLRLQSYSELSAGTELETYKKGKKKVSPRARVRTNRDRVTQKCKTFMSKNSKTTENPHRSQPNLD